MMIFIISCIILFLFVLFDTKYEDHIPWYLITLVLVISLSGCSSIPPTPYDNDPIIWIE